MSILQREGMAMDWLITNPISMMWGPYFLAFYGAMGFLLIVFGRWQQTRSDRSKGRNRMPVPSEIDPFRLAYLRGGIPELLRLITVDLFQRQILIEGKKGVFSQKGFELDPNASLQDLTPPQRAVAEFYRECKRPTEIFRSNLLRGRLEKEIAEWENWTLEEELRFSSQDKQSHSVFVACVIGGFVSLGAYKLISAISRGFTNIELLVVMMIVGSLILFFATRLPKFTWRGRRFIEDIQAAFASMRKPNWKTGEYAEDNGLSHSLPVMAMGIFGIAALQDGPYGFLHNQYARAASAGSSCGSCGASSCSSGSGCGGGGGCGGSGCGGCGGGCS